MVPKKDSWDLPHNIERKYSNSIDFIMVSYYTLPLV